MNLFQKCQEILVQVRFLLEMPATISLFWMEYIPSKQKVKHWGKLALNYNRFESAMQYVSENEITSYFNSLNVRKLNTEGISTMSDIQQLTLKNPNEFWRILLILALAFLLLEMLIIIFWKV